MPQNHTDLWCKWALYRAVNGSNGYCPLKSNAWQIAFLRAVLQRLAGIQEEILLPPGACFFFYLFFFLNSNFTSRDCAATASQSFGSWSWCSPIEGRCCLSNHAGQVKIASAAACVQSCQAVMLEFQWVARWAEKVWLIRLFLLPSGHQCSRAKSEKP